MITNYQVEFEYESTIYKADLEIFSSPNIYKLILRNITPQPHPFIKELQFDWDPLKKVLVYPKPLISPAFYETAIESARGFINRENLELPFNFD
jgi:hypothetical protein